MRDYDRGDAIAEEMGGPLKHIWPKAKQILEQFELLVKDGWEAQRYDEGAQDPVEWLGTVMDKLLAENGQAADWGWAIYVAMRLQEKQIIGSVGGPRWKFGVRKQAKDLATQELQLALLQLALMQFKKDVIAEERNATLHH